MKVSLNQTISIYNNRFTNFDKKVSHIDKPVDGDVDKSLKSPNLSYSHFPNISFKMDPNMAFLLSQSKKFKCAYSGLEMISPFQVRSIYAQLQKRPNAQSAINYLKQYEKFMHDIESRVFSLLEEAPHKNKRDFQNILQEEAPAALVRLKEKQKLVLTSVDNIIDRMSPDLAAQVRAIREESLLKMENDTFGRKAPLEAIKKIKASGSDLEKIISVYRAWYKLPSSGKDIDAFIVSYSKKPHEDISKRLISSAVATVEHIRPQSCGGEDRLENFILVSAQYNNERNTMPLWEYIMLNPQIDIRKNLQLYMDTLIKEVHNKKSEFYQCSWYPEAVKHTIKKQTSGSIELETKTLNLTKDQKRKNGIYDRLSTKYIVTKK